MQGGERVLAQRHHVVQLAPALPALAFATHRNPGDSSCDAIERTCLEARLLDAPTGEHEAARCQTDVAMCQNTSSL